MKKSIFLFTMLLMTSVIFSQDRVSLAIYQDPSLALFADDNGNEPFTLNILARAELQGKQFKTYYGSLTFEFEHADLFGGVYNRYGIGYGWTFNKNSLASDNLEYSLGANTGFIQRFHNTYKLVFGLTGDISYKLGNNFKVSVLGQFINREDLRSEYHLTKFGDYVKFSGYIGFKYVFN